MQDHVSFLVTVMKLSCSHLFPLLAAQEVWKGHPRGGLSQVFEK